MEELLAQIVLALVETFFDAILELAGEALMDLLSRAASEVFKSDEPPHPIRSFLALGFLGALVGGASLVIFPHPLFHRSRFHGISLIISPIATGAAMSAFGAVLRSRGKRVVQIERFPYAVVFAFGMALVRLIWAF